MKSIFDKPTREAIIARIKTLNEDSTPQWGKMNIYQMLKHCTLTEEMYLGDKIYPRQFIGRLLGRIALKSLTKDDAPMGKNAPTSNDFKIKQTEGNVTELRDKWASLIERYHDFDNPNFTHWFFGKMTKEQIGQLAYKHADHHLKQFGA
ncbi:MAG TPA: DUF1569 domain-containing protein [Mucilaginibacter sp.]|jgi:Protein of unknown function (DUF1569).